MPQQTDLVPNLICRISSMHRVCLYTAQFEIYSKGLLTTAETLEKGPDLRIQCHTNKAFKQMSKIHDKLLTKAMCGW